MSRDHEPTIADVMNGLTRTRKRKPPPSPVEPPGPPARSDGGAPEPGWPAAEPVVPMVRLQDPAESAAIVRPYAWTRGRTRSNFELRLETMVSTSARAADASAFAESEHRAIGELCREPRSVAEVATLLGAPLGVAKVLLGDMAQLGLVTVHKTATGGANRAHLVLMERVLSGLRRL
ncbi:DUF742 domain-containing protein [Actinokineospora sp. 24-640]